VRQFLRLALATYPSTGAIILVQLFPSLPSVTPKETRVPFFNEPTILLLVLGLVLTLSDEFTDTTQDPTDVWAI